MKINWKARFKNKAFLISFIALILSFVYKALEIFEICPFVLNKCVGEFSRIDGCCG